MVSPIHNVTGGFDPVHHVFHPEFLGNDTSFVGGGVVAVKPGGDLLPFGGRRQKVTGQLLDGELIERHVVLVGVEHPVSPGPHVTGAVIMKDGGVTVSRGVHPDESHAFGVGFGGE